MIIVLCSIVIVIAEKGEKRMIRDGYIKGFFFWPEVKGDKVPIIARRYKLMARAFAGIFIIASLLFMVIAFKS
jgi:hypothetical protein